MTRPIFCIVLLIIAVLSLAACDPPAPAPTETPETTSTAITTTTPAIIPAPRPTPSPTPTQTAVATPAATPSTTPSPPAPTSPLPQVDTATQTPSTTETQPAPTPTATPTAETATTPTPASTVTPPPTPTAAPTPTAIVAPAVTPTPSPTPTPTVAQSVEQPQFSVSLDHATLQFPDSVSFHMEGRSEKPIESVDLEFGVDLVFSCASISYWTARADLEPGEDVSVTWEWDMRRSGSMPPGSVIWWSWRLTDDEGQEMLTPRRETNFADARFDWDSHTDGNVTFNWYAGGEDFGRRISDGVRTGLETLKLGRELVAPITVFVYESSEDVRGAVLFAQEWTGGLAYVHQNIILITVDPANFDSGLPGVVHELAHLLVEEVTFNCFGGLPTWLNEGLAVYAEGGLPESQKTALEEAIATDELISLRSLNSSFPVGHSDAILSYAQSYSLVAYLLNAYGWPRMQELLAIFSEGSTDEKALRQVYGLEYEDLETDWRQSLGLSPRRGG